MYIGDGAFTSMNGIHQLLNTKNSKRKYLIKYIHNLSMSNKCVWNQYVTENVYALHTKGILHTYILKEFIKKNKILIRMQITFNYNVRIHYCLKIIRLKYSSNLLLSRLYNYTRSQLTCMFYFACIRILEKKRNKHVTDSSLMCIVCIFITVYSYLIILK